MANVVYTSQAYNTGVSFTPSTTENRKVTLKDMFVSGAIVVPEKQFTQNPLNIIGYTGTLAGTETITNLDLVVNPDPASRTVVINTTTAIATYQLYGQGNITINSVQYHLDSIINATVTLNLTDDQKANLTVSNIFTPFVKTHTAGSIVAIAGVNTPVFDFTMQAFELNAEGLSDIDVVLAIDA